MNNNLVQCEICGKWFSTKGIGVHNWRTHGEGINFNPNRGYKEGIRKAWNKGLTKETNESVLKMANSLKRVQSSLEQIVNDDGKLKQRYINKRTNAKQENIEFNLTYEQFIQLVVDADLKSSQLGFTGENYVLARYNDCGGYTLGNCRFITQKENSDEKNDRLFPNRKRENNCI